MEGYSLNFIYHYYFQVVIRIEIQQELYWHKTEHINMYTFCPSGLLDKKRKKLTISNMHVVYRQRNSFVPKDKASGVCKRIFLYHTEDREGGVMKGYFLKVQ